MKSNAYLFCTLCLLFLVLFPLVGVSRAQDTRALEERISELRGDERNLEQIRDRLKEDIRKVESKDESNRSSNVVIQIYAGNTSQGQFTPIYAIVPREEYERRTAVAVLIGTLTLQQALQENRRTFGMTAAFPQEAMKTLSEIEQKLAETKKELLARMAERDQLKIEGKRSVINDNKCKLAGTWSQTTQTVGTSTWTITDSGKATESGLGSVSGTASLSGKLLRIVWSHPNGWSGAYEWNLDSNCNSGSGKLVFKSGGSGTHTSTVTRQ
jgi:hypothetical protein